jgi:hypothetical protein
MKTSSNNTPLIEQYLRGELAPADRLLFEARLLLSPALRTTLHLQKKTYLLVKMYHRKKVQEELEAIHRQLFSDPAKRVFQQNIDHLFQSTKL